MAALGVAGALFLSGCSRGTHGSAFCSTIRSRHPAFDHVSAQTAPVALAAFDRIVAGAPTAVRPDLQTVASTFRVLFEDPTSLSQHPDRLATYFAAVGRVDQYLNRSCGIDVTRGVTF